MVGWFLEHWGTMSQLILGLVALLLAIRPKAVLDLEERSPKWKIFVPLIVGIIAITGYMVAESNDGKLKGQLATMFQQVKLEATKGDIGDLIAHIDSGFKSVTDAIEELCKPKKQPAKIIPQPVIVPLPVPPHVSVTQSRAVSTDSQFRYGLQVTIQSDQSIPASFQIECTGAVGKVDAFMVGRAAYMEVMLGSAANNPNVAIVHYGYPPLTPQSPLVVTILSKEDIRVTGVKPL